MFHGRPIMQGETDEAQLTQIWKLCGTPTGNELPNWSLVVGADHHHQERKLGLHFKQYVALPLAFSSYLCSRCGASLLTNATLWFLSTTATEANLLTS
jgi:hypothetical protein